MSEFHAFLFTLNYSSENKWVHNALLDSQRLHMRAILFFFSHNKKTHSDDLQYFDILDSQYKELEIDYDNVLRDFINKQTAHITKRRGKLNFSEEKYIETRDLVVTAIENFLTLIPTNIRPEYKKYLNSDDTQKALGAVNVQLITFLLNKKTENGERNGT